MIDLKNQTPLTLEQIAKAAPAVVEQHASPRVSKHYIHIPTTRILDDMEKLGWRAIGVDQQKSGDLSKDRFAKHLIAFRNENVVLRTEDGETVWPQVLIQNSHNALGAFSFNAGLHRLACSNGLVVSTKSFGALRIRHRGYSFEELQVTIMKMMEELPGTVEVLNRFREVQLTEEQKIEFALSAMGIRFAGDEAAVEAKLLLAPLREADKGSSLWATYNVLQEKVIKGNFTYTTPDGKSRTAKPIIAFQRSIKMNKELYALAEQYT